MAVPPGIPLEDGQLILKLGGIQGNGRPDIKLTQEINLLLVDDPSPYKQALGDRLEQLHQSLSGWVLPRIFAYGRRKYAANTDLVSPQDDRLRDARARDSYAHRQTR